MSASEPPAPADAIEQAILDLWGVINDLSRLPPPQTDYFRVSIFGSARVKPQQPLYEDVKRLATRLSAAGCDIVTGGGPGLMQAANEGEQAGDPENRTRSIGVRVKLPFEQEANPFVEKLFTHRTFFSRLHQFTRLSDAFVIVGGGIGTLLETTLVWQLLQVDHLRGVPLIMIGPMYRDLVGWARTHMLDGPTAYAAAPDIDIPHCVDTVDEAADIIEALRAKRGATTDGA